MHLDTGQLRSRIIIIPCHYSRFVCHATLTLPRCGSGGSCGSSPPGLGLAIDVMARQDDFLNFIETLLELNLS